MRSGTSSTSATGSSSPAASPRAEQRGRQHRPRSPSRTWRRINLDTGLIDTTFRPDLRWRRRQRGRGLARRHQAVRRRHLQHRQRRHQAQDRLAQPDHRRPGRRLHRQRRTARPTRSRVSNTTVYVGGQFTRHQRRRPASASPRSTRRRAPSTLGFDNNLSGGIGTNGTLTVQQLKLTHDSSKLLVVHTARQIDGQDRYGVGLIDTATKQLLPWRTPPVGRQPAVRRRHPAHLRRATSRPTTPTSSSPAAPVATGRRSTTPPSRSRSTGGDDVQPLWISRAFDSVYSVAITEKAVYIGGHFQLERVADRARPVAGPRQRRLRHRPGPRRRTASATTSSAATTSVRSTRPTGKALEWNPGSNSFEGNKAMEVTSRGLIAGGDAGRQGGGSTGPRRVLRLQPAARGRATPTPRSRSPIEGRVVADRPAVHRRGHGDGHQRPLARVQVEVAERQPVPRRTT